MSFGSLNIVNMKFCKALLILLFLWGLLTFLISERICAYSISRSALSGIRNSLKKRESKLKWTTKNSKGENEIGKFNTITLLEKVGFCFEVKLDLVPNFFLIQVPSNHIWFRANSTIPKPNHQCLFCNRVQPRSHERFSKENESF